MPAGEQRHQDLLDDLVLPDDDLADLGEDARPPSATRSAISAISALMSVHRRFQLQLRSARKSGDRLRTQLSA